MKVVDQPVAVKVEQSSEWRVGVYLWLCLISVCLVVFDIIFRGRVS